jgi:NTE family protein
LIASGAVQTARWAGMRIHRIASEAMIDLGYSSKLNAEWGFLCKLRDEGRRCAEAFLKAHAEDLGHHSPFNLDTLLEQV